MILVEILRKSKYKKKKEIIMSKDWQRGSGYVDAPKITKELGAGKDGYPKGGVKIEATDPIETQTVTVKGTKRLRSDKKPVKAKWF
jgi:hypothetical protein